MRVGVSTGFLNAKYSLEFNGDETSNTEIEYYAGLSFDFKTSSKIDLNTQLLYYKSEKLAIPILAKYSATKDLSLLFGGQMTIELNKVAEDFNALNYYASLGASFDVDKNLPFMQDITIN